MAQDELRTIQTHKGLPEYCRAAALAAWQGLAAQGHVMWVDGQLESRGRDCAYAGVLLRVSEDTLEAGLREHPTCPEALWRFFHQEV